MAVQLEGELLGKVQEEEIQEEDGARTGDFLMGIDVSLKSP